MKVHATMLLSSVLVATSFPVAASIAGELDSTLLTLLRFVLAALLFLPLVILRHRARMLPGGRSLLRYGALSALLVAFFVAMFEALRTTTALNTGALFTLGPGLAALFAWPLVRERLDARRLLALVLGLLGALWVVLGGRPARLLRVDLVVGDGLFLAGTASIALYSVLVRRLRRGEPTAVMTFWTLATGSLWLLVLGADELLALRWSTLEPRVVWAIAYLALFTTLATFLLTQHAIQVIGPTRALGYTYLNPALVALLSWAVGDGAPGWRALPGLGLTLAALLVLQRREPDAAAGLLLPADSGRRRACLGPAAGVR